MAQLCVLYEHSSMCLSLLQCFYGAELCDNHYTLHFPAVIANILINCAFVRLMLRREA